GFSPDVLADGYLVRSGVGILVVLVLGRAPLAQGIEHRPPEPGAQVRILQGALTISSGNQRRPAETRVFLLSGVFHSRVAGLGFRSRKGLPVRAHMLHDGLAVGLMIAFPLVPARS